MNFSTNPFASRFIRPGAIPYLARDGKSPQFLADQFLQSHSPALAIVGPHGSGKSTLLHALLPFLGTLVEIDNVASSELFLPSRREPIGRRIHFFRLHAKQSPSPLIWKSLERACDSDLFVIDGFEQLGWFHAWWVLRRVRKNRSRLLLTCHRPIAGVPSWMETHVDREVESHVLRHLIGDTHWMDEEAWIASRQRRGQNLRESLMDLYDRVELQHA